MNSIVIHNNNIDINLFENRVRYIENNHIDKYISEDIVQNIKSQTKLDIIFIKDNLSSNYLELLGLRVAYHIRLSQELGNLKFLPIVIISDLDSCILNKIEPLARILFTKNIYICKNKKEDIEKYKYKKYRNLTEKEYQENFLNLIKLEPPKDYLSHHSIANEWSIYRWTKFLDVRSEATKKVENQISSMLYFKYLKAKYEQKDNYQIEPKTPQKSGKVLLIDDEWNKGWSDILAKVFEDSSIDFKAFEYDYKDKNRFNLIVQGKHKELNEQIKNADVVVLDLRLAQNDHDEHEDIENFTGIKLLKIIHEINAGIQVIMLTATGKSTILEKLYDYKIAGYIKKEHPDDWSINAVENINKFVKLIDNGLQNKYLKDIYNIQQELLNLDFINDKKYKKIKFEINLIMDILDNNIQSRFKMAMLSIYRCLEMLIKLYIYEKWHNNKSYAYWRDTNEKIDNDGQNSTENKLLNILHHKLNIIDIDTDIKKIVCSRNFAIHGGEIKPRCKNKTEKNIDRKIILEWFKMLRKILNAVKV
jgi:CheY-like chemotaxis protein